MRIHHAIAFIFMAVPALYGCNSSTSDEAATPDTAPVAASTQAARKTAPERKTRAFVRGVHVVPGIDPITLQVGGQKIGAPFGFGNASDFTAIAPGERVEIKAIGSANNNVAGPMPQKLEAGDDLTVVVNGVPGDVALLPLKSKSGGPQKNRAKIAFLHAAKALNAVQLQFDGEKFRGDVDYGQNTDYKTLTPGRHTMQISYDQAAKATPVPTPTLVPGQISAQPTPAKAREIITLSQQIDALAGKVYTVVLFYDAAKLPKLRVLEDRFADTLQNAPVANASPQ